MAAAREIRGGADGDVAGYLGEAKFEPRSLEEKEVWEVLLRVKASEEPMYVTLSGPAACGKTVAVSSVFGHNGVYPAWHVGERPDAHPGAAGCVRMPCGREISDKLVLPELPLGSNEVDAVVLEGHERLAEFKAIVAMQALGVAFFAHKKNSDDLVPVPRIRHVVVTERKDGPFTASAEPISLTIDTVRGWLPGM